MPVMNPFIMANRQGIPRLEATGVTVGTSSVVFSFKPHRFMDTSFSGLVLFRLPGFTAPDDALPVVFDTAGVSRNLTTYGGADVTSSQLNASGVYLAYCEGSMLQLITSL